MDKLLVKYNEYMRFKDCKVEYKLDNGVSVEFVYKEENFPHLLGLHKLKDIQLIQFWQDKNNKTVKLDTVIKRIRKTQFTDAVVNFNPNIIKSSLKSDYILFEEKNASEYNHMGIALDRSGNYRYAETFFHELSDKYIFGQKVVKVNEFTLYDKNENVIVHDSF